MKKLLIAAGALATALSGSARAQAPAGAPPAVPPDPAPGMAQPAPTAEPFAPSSPAPVATSNSAGFGLAGQIVISGDLQVSSSYTSYSMSSGSATSVLLRPSLDFFVIPNLSVGGFVSYSTSSFSPSGGGSSISGPSSFGIGGRAGYNIAMGPLVSFWPQLQLAYDHESQGSGSSKSTAYAVQLAVLAPFLFHLAPHFFVGIGPEISTELIAKAQSNDAPKATSIGATSIVGGYF